MYRLADDVRSALTEDGGVVLDIQRGQILRVNSVAAHILDLLKQECSVAEIASSIVRTYGIGEETAQADIREFLQTLETYHLLRPQPKA